MCCALVMLQCIRAVDAVSHLDDVLLQLFDKYKFLLLIAFY